MAPSYRIAILDDKGEAIFKQNTQLAPGAEWTLGLAVFVRRTNRPEIGVIPVPFHGVANEAERLKIGQFVAASFVAWYDVIKLQRTFIGRHPTKLAPKFGILQHLVA